MRRTQQNPLRRGWSRQVIDDNIREMMHGGRQQKQAIAAALTAARKSYRQKHPVGAFPEHLKRTRTNPLFKAGPNAAKAGVKYQRGVVKQNMKPRYVIENPHGRDFSQAVRLYESFHGADPRYVDEVYFVVPDVAMTVGKIFAIEYEKPHNKKDRFRHEFSGASMPTLAVSHDGSQLLILDGRYHFNDHGIIDGPAPE